MRTRSGHARLISFRTARATAVVLLTLLGALSWASQIQLAAQSRPYRAPRTQDGKPDLNGIWQAMNTANWDLEDHAARSGPVVALGAFGAIPAGMGVVEGGEIPYQPWALAKKKENARQLADARS